MRALLRGVKASVRNASSTFLPRIASAMRRHFCGEIRAYLNVAATCMTDSSAYLFGGGFPIAGMTSEGSCHGKFAQLVTNHVFRNEHGHVLPTVMHCNRQSNHVRQHHRASRPRPDGTSIVRFHGRRNLFRQVRIDKRAFSD
jgi:hypothetical protein